VKSLLKLGFFAPLVAAAIALSGEPGTLPNEHPIYKVPKPVTREEVIVAVQKVLHRGFGSPDHARDLRWSIKLPKQRYYLAEVIWARLRVENTGPYFAYKLNPPYHGAYVSTIGVWVSRFQEGGHGQDAKWSELRETYWVNRGHYEGGRRYGGIALVLQPGECYEAWIPINVAQREISGFLVPGGRYWRSSWNPGVGFSQPGKYRFYVRYINLVEMRCAEATAEANVRNRDLPGRASRSSIPNAADLPRAPIVLGPYEVDILPLPSSPHDIIDLAQGIGNVVRNWEQMCAEPVWDVFTNADRGIPYLPVLIRGRLGEREYGIRWPLEFAILRQARAPIDSCLGFAGGARPSPEAARSKTLWNLEAILSWLPEHDPLREHVELQRCVALYWLGEKGQALSLAERLKTPDAQMFIHDVRESEARAKPRRYPGED